MRSMENPSPIKETYHIRPEPSNVLMLAAKLVDYANRHSDPRLPNIWMSIESRYDEETCGIKLIAYSNNGGERTQEDVASLVRENGNFKFHIYMHEFFQSAASLEDLVKPHRLRMGTVNCQERFYGGNTNG